MTFNWNIPVVTVVLLALQLIGGAIAIMKVIASIQRTIDSRFAHFELIMNTFKEGDLRELKVSVSRLESGQDEWTKSLRQRTHELGNVTNDLMLRVDRLERPERYNRRTEDEKA